MSKLNWSLTIALLITSLAVSCGRQASELGVTRDETRDETPTVATRGVALADLVAMARQVGRFHRRQQQIQGSRQRENELRSVAYALPEKEQQDFRALLSEKTIADLQQSVQQLKHRLNGGLSFAVPQAFVAMNRFKETVIKPYWDEAEDETEVSASDEQARPGTYPFSDQLAARRAVLQSSVHRCGLRLASLRATRIDCLTCRRRWPNGHGRAGRFTPAPAACKKRSSVLR